jgi:putative ABC transport system substrate-binding protein
VELVCGDGTLSGFSAAWPLATFAQQPHRMRRIGMLMDTAESNSEEQARVAAFRQVLRDRG